MLNMKIYYTGNSRKFSQALSSTAKSLKISYKKITPPSFSGLTWENNTLWLLDADFIDPQITPTFLDHLPTDTQIVLVVSSYTQIPKNIPQSLQQKVSDIFVKSCQKEVLQKKIEFFLNFFTKLDKKEETPESHDLSKKNHSLTRQVAHLQEQLSQIDSDLQVQEEVLEKINQISQLSRQINCLDLDHIAGVCVEQIPQLISARFASIYTFSAENQTLYLLRHNHPFTIDREISLEKKPNSPMAMAVKKRELLLIKDIPTLNSNEGKNMALTFSRNYSSKSCIIAPLLSGENILGVLNLADKVSEPHFTSNIDLPPVQLLCEIIGSAMSNIKLYEEVRLQARTDSMTGLFNHHTFYNELDKEILRAKRYGSSLSLIMIDLDNLKATNDKNGHRCGDAVLIHVAKTILHCIRETDIAARYGGDEFAIILPSTSLSDAMNVAQRMVEMVAEKPIQGENTKVRVSISLGVGQYCDYYTIEDFMNTTDAAMFKAKTEGKNRIHVVENSLV
jgi:diguanylate cyclase (GGDEF)-like protein